MRSCRIQRTSIGILACCLLCWFSACHAQAHRFFSVQGGAETETINGQIDWPGGKLSHWRSPVFAFISAAGPVDRDGWLVTAHQTLWANREPLKQLADAMLRQGFAVVRFDNPGVRQPHWQCREAIRKWGLTQDIVFRRCIETEVLRRSTAAKYVNSIERALLQVQRMMPAARNNLVLFGFSEGGVHAASIVERNQVKVSALITLGTPAESMATLTHWQAVERILETLPEFDANGDGVVLNEEIERGYRAGVGNFMNLEGWLSSSGRWDKQSEGVLRERADVFYQSILASIPSDGSVPGKLQWVQDVSGVLVPDITDSIWNLHFHGVISPGDILRRHSIPGFFIWGGKDRQVGVSRQVRVLRDFRVPKEAIEYAIFSGRHHLLSEHADLDWFEPDFMPVVAKKIQDFIDSHFHSCIAHR